MVKRDAHFVSPNRIGTVNISPTSLSHKDNYLPKRFMEEKWLATYWYLLALNISQFRPRIQSKHILM
jgi:hypothetical protein